MLLGGQGIVKNNCLSMAFVLETVMVSALRDETP
jgi:hypothetical protein